MYVKYYLRKKERGEDGEREKKEGEGAEGRALRRELQQRKESAKRKRQSNIYSLPLSLP